MSATQHDYNEAISEAMTRSFFAAFPPALVERILADAVPIDVPAGGVLYREQESPRCVLVVSGLIRVYLSSPTGREATVRYARPGDVLGIAVIVGGPVGVSVQILSDATLLLLNVTTLQDIGKSVPGVGWLMAEEMTRRLYETLEVLAGNVFGTVRQRIARHLLDLAATQQRGSTLVAKVTQQELADAVGSVRPVVARALGELRDTGLISSTSAGIAVLDPAGLHEEVRIHDPSQM